MPCYAGASSDGAKLVDNVARNEVDVIVSQAKSGITNAVATKLIQFSLLYPLPALQRVKKRGKMNQDLLQN